MSIASVETDQGTIVKVLDPQDASDAVDLLARGFAEEPGNLALFPDPEDRREWMVSSLRNQVSDALRHGTAHVALVNDELAGAALWHPPGVGGVSLRGAVRAAGSLLPLAPVVGRNARHLRATVLATPREAIAMTVQRQKAMDTASRGATWHLAFLATAPEHRGKGVARALLDRQLRRCDEDAAAVWLETTDPVNPPIYERFGFEVTTHIEDAAWLPGYWVMRREPQPLG